jgi:hypothetical protein
MVLFNGSSANRIFWVSKSYVALAPGSTSVGTFIANSDITLSSAGVSGAVLSVSATVTLTTSAVRLPWRNALTATPFNYNTRVDISSASGFALLGASSVLNVVSGS